MIRIEIGPVSAVSARAWLDVARPHMKSIRELRRELPFQLPDDVADVFEFYLDEWAQVASGQDRFHWVSAVDPDELARLMHYWFNVAQFMASDGPKWDLEPAPSEADDFYVALVDSVLAALTADGPHVAVFSDRLRSVWPSFDREPAQIDLTENTAQQADDSDVSHRR